MDDAAILATKRELQSERDQLRASIQAKQDALSRLPLTTAEKEAAVAKERQERREERQCRRASVLFLGTMSMGFISTGMILITLFVVSGVSCATPDFWVTWPHQPGEHCSYMIIGYIIIWLGLIIGLFAFGELALLAYCRNCRTPCE
jgi:hypothetical protein